MDNRCPHCSGYGTVPDPRAVHYPRIACPKCEGNGRPRVVKLPPMMPDEALRVLRGGRP
jgi:DnaJ-class molecular chaperone